MKLRLAALSLLLAPLAALQAGGDASIVGAILWDAWYGEGGATKAVEASLGQPKYHFRQPWFARVVGGDKVGINGGAQTRDTRPRNERPPPWFTRGTVTPDKTPPAQQKPLIDPVTATPDELAAHLREALDWTKANRDLNPSNAVIIYGWNENDEGGWLLPTLGADGKPDEARINAMGKILRLKDTWDLGR